MLDPRRREALNTHMDQEYDYSAAAARSARQNSITPTSASAQGVRQNRLYTHPNNNNNTTVEAEALPHDEEEEANAEEALLDLAELEELHEEAERMKAVGNKHMAQQEYIPAYHAYSAALQLSPVGPSSHVFLSNRAASLLSLKKYSQAATDARRAVALAPTFGKAHARLGQALYFLKDYENAVSAYQDALQFEPDNRVTQTYLEKAQAKWDKQQLRKSGGGGGDTVASSVAGGESVWMQASVVTDMDREHNVVQDYHRPHARAMQRAAAAATGVVSPRVASASPPPIESPNGAQHKVPTTVDTSNDNNQEDFEFEEAIRIQQRANAYLVHKKYKQAIEEYTAALFLVPDDENLSPDLHLGRAHALNGSRRHEAAKNDANMALKLSKTAAGYSTLAKSLFYMKDFQGAVDAFMNCQRQLPAGETLGMFDQAYLEKAEKAVNEEQASLQAAGKRDAQKEQPHYKISNPNAVIPKLPPPRFVPREQAVNSPPNAARSMPKTWPRQNLDASATVPFQCGRERKVLCLSEALGVKLNRGSDGRVRVLHVTSVSESPGLLRHGDDILVGDVIREVAGVDIRRPITNLMWGDTVALIKMAPRPIQLIVAKEVSPVPPSVLDEQKKAAMPANTNTPPPPTTVTTQPMGERPSRSSGDQAVGATTTTQDSNDDDEDSIRSVEEDSPPVLQSEEEKEVAATNPETTVEDGEEEKQIATEPETTVDEEEQNNGGVDEADEEQQEKDLQSEIEAATDMSVPPPQEEESSDDIVEVEDNKSIPIVSAPPNLDTVAEVADEEDKTQESSVVGMGADDDDDDSIKSVEDENSVHSAVKASSPARVNKSHESSEPYETPQKSLRDEEERVVGGEILFLRDTPPAYGGWDTLRWMSHNGARKVNFCQKVYRLAEVKKRKGLPMFWKTGGTNYVERALVVYDEPNLILVVRRPENLEEIHGLLGLEDFSLDAGTGNDSDWALNPDTAMQSYWILESVADPVSSKLRLSPLTTPTSDPPKGGASARDCSCFQILTPKETICLSAVDVRSEAKQGERSFSDGGAFLETLSVESLISQAICAAHHKSADIGDSQTDIAWKHQVVIGSLHSLVMSGNQKSLEEGIERARATASRGGADANFDPKFLPSRIIDAVDDNGYPALYYSCTHKMEGAVRALVNAGADISFRTDVNGLSMTHVSARNLDDRSLSTILAATYPARPDPNALDKKGRTPMYVAMVEGSVLDNGKDPTALARCIKSLEAWGGTTMAPGSSRKLRNPVSALAYMWLSDYLAVLLDHSPFRFPLGPDPDSATQSLGAMYQYPVHSALIALRKHSRKHITITAGENHVVKTLRVLFGRGFEPNERLDAKAFGSERTSLDEFEGYAPLHILALVALELESVKADLDEGVFEESLKALADIAEFLVKNGARLSLDPPMVKRLRAANSQKSPGSKPERKVQILTAKLDSDKRAMTLLGGQERLSKAQKDWNEHTTIANTSITHFADDETVVEDSNSAGGSDSLSCAICWSEFGAIMNRKHKCRVTNRYVCDPCSTKRVVEDIKHEHRLSDGQFLLASADSIRKDEEQKAAAKAAQQNKTLKMDQAKTAARLGRLEAEQTANRDSLFGGMIESATNYVMGEGDATQSTSRQVEGLTATLDQTRDALNQRGEKLASLGDKSAQMVDASADFANMAKELRKQSEGGFFW